MKLNNQSLLTQYYMQLSCNKKFSKLKKNRHHWNLRVNQDMFIREKIHFGNQKSNL